METCGAMLAIKDFWLVETRAYIFAMSAAETPAMLEGLEPLKKGRQRNEYWYGIID